MNQIIEQYLNAKEYDKLRFIFSNALANDPTFESYRDDYEHCKDYIVQEHVELTPFQSDGEGWDDMRYWGRLKAELNQNFSEKRFAHMQEVAKVLFADRLAEKQKAAKRMADEKEAKRRVTEDARRSTEEEIKRRAAEDAKRKAAEEETKRKAVEEAISMADSENTLPKQKAPVMERPQKTRFTLVESPEQRMKREKKERRTLIVWVIGVLILVIVVLFLIKFVL